MRFSIALGVPSPNMNRQSRRESGIGGTAERYGETSYRQTPQEHQALLNRYMGIKGIPPEIARAMGEEEEKASPRYWDTDSTPRYGGSTPSSSFVQAMDVSPALGLVTFTMKNGRSYSYPLSADQAGDIINANSIGAAYNKMCKLGRSNIPVMVSPRSGNRTGPAPMIIGGRGRSQSAAPAASSNAGGVMAPALIRVLGGVANLLKK